MCLEQFASISTIIGVFVAFIGVIPAIIFFLNHLRSDPFKFEINLPILEPIKRKTVYEKDAVYIYVFNCTDYSLKIIINIKLYIKNQLVSNHSKNFTWYLNPKTQNEQEIDFISYINKEFRLTGENYNIDPNTLVFEIQVTFKNRWFSVWKLKKSLSSKWVFNDRPKTFTRIE